MELRTKQRNKNVQRLEENYKQGIYSYLDDNSDADEQILTDEDYNDAPLEADEETDDNYNDDDYNVSTDNFSVKPVWILLEGEIIWATSHITFKLEPKEYLRRRLQMLLNFLHGQFPEKPYEDLLLSLQGFFVKDNNKDDKNSDYWLYTLKNAGILYGYNKLLKDKIMPLRNFRVGSGKGRNEREDKEIARRLPKNLEYIWLERELSKPERASQNKPLSWKNCSGWLIDGLNKFCDTLNKFCEIFESDTQGMSLKKTKFSYKEDTVRRKMLGKWAKWWDIKRKEQGAKNGK